MCVVCVQEVAGITIEEMSSTASTACLRLVHFNSHFTLHFIHVCMQSFNFLTSFLQHLLCFSFANTTQITNTNTNTNNYPPPAIDMVSLRELDVRAAKKQVCKVNQEVADSLIAQRCMLRGGVIKKSKKQKKASATIGF